MKLALIGKSISHSKSPELYKEIFSGNISYDLLDIASEAELPSLTSLAETYLGLNITTPYKTSYINEVVINDSRIKRLGAINTISFCEKGFIGTNTDLIAVEKILTGFKTKFSNINIVLLGNGVMAEVTKLVADGLGLGLIQLSRRKNGPIEKYNLKQFHKPNRTLLVINACSRSFEFSGEISSDSIFWDYNYRFIPHQKTLPSLVKEYFDGQGNAEASGLRSRKFLENN